MRYLIISLVAVAALIIGLSIYLQPNDFIGCGEKPAGIYGQCSSADAIVVVSGGDTNARTDSGIALYKNGWADTLIFSGAAQDKSGPSNAEAMMRRALTAGVPANDILLDEYSETTQQNAANAQSIFSENNIEKIILTTSGYHQKRANLEFQRNTDNVTVLNYPVTRGSDWSFWWWVTPRGWWLAGGEIVKIVIFHIQGAVS